jgi:hypothetical protein
VGHPHLIVRCTPSHSHSQNSLFLTPTLRPVNQADTLSDHVKIPNLLVRYNRIVIEILLCHRYGVRKNQLRRLRPPLDSHSLDERGELYRWDNSFRQ